MRRGYQLHGKHYSELALPRTDDLRTRRLKNPLVIRTCQARFLANKNVSYFSTAR